MAPRPLLRSGHGGKPEPDRRSQWTSHLSCPHTYAYIAWGGYRHLAPAGKLVVYGFHTMLPRQGGRPNYAKLAVDFVRTPRFSPLDLCNDNKSVLAFNLSYLFHKTEILREGMERLLGWVEEGRIQPPPVKLFPLERVADAHRALESGSTVGKLVLQVAR